jgi:hypothetical protein
MKPPVSVDPAAPPARLWFLATWVLRSAVPPTRTGVYLLAYSALDAVTHAAVYLGGLDKPMPDGFLIEPAPVVECGRQGLRHVGPLCQECMNTGFVPAHGASERLRYPVLQGGERACYGSML